MYKVILVDDEPLAIKGLQLFIDWEAFGFKIAGVCENGEDALKLIMQEQPDVVFTDVRMPVMDGFELITNVRNALEKTVHFVILSGYSEFEYARKAMLSGVQHYLLKPIIPEEADEVLHKLCRLLEEETRVVQVRSAVSETRLKAALLRLLQGQFIDWNEDSWSELLKLSPVSDAWYYLSIEADTAMPSELLQSVEAVIERYGNAYLIQDSNESIGIVYGSSESDGFSDITLFAEGLHSAANPKGSHEVRIHVGERTSDLFSICHSLRGEEKALYSHDPNLSVQPLLEAIESLDTTQAISRIQMMFTDFVSRRVTPNWVNVFMMQFIYKCMSIVKGMNGNLSELLAQLDRYGFQSRKLTMMETMDLFIRFATEVIKALRSLKERKSNSILFEMEEYIRLHYRESLTVKQIAQQFYINPVYAGQIFHKKFGLSILDFVHNLRINEAKQLLLETDNKLKQVAEQVGYSHYNHFLLQFEKRTGRKPAQYKIKLQ